MLWKERYRERTAKKNDPVYQADCRKALRVGGHPENEYWLLPLAWGLCEISSSTIPTGGSGTERSGLFPQNDRMCCNVPTPGCSQATVQLDLCGRVVRRQQNIGTSHRAVMNACKMQRRLGRG
jgi:hypothetical protein